MSTEYPLVTVISPCYNHAAYIEESLDSVRLQTYPNIEHIIIDDCSADDSATIIEEWIKKHNYNCTFIKHTENRGLSRTLNESIELGKGFYWMPAATDDFILPKRTSVFVDFMINHPEINMVTSDCILVDEHSTPITRNGTGSFLTYYTIGAKGFNMNDFGTYECLLQRNTIPSSLLLRKDVFEKVGYFVPGLAIEDWDMWLRVSRLGRIAYIPEALTFYRFHDSNTVSKKSLMIPGVAKTIIAQHAYCKKNNLLPAFNRAYINNIFFSPFHHPGLTFRVMMLGPVHLYIAEIFKKTAARIFRKKTKQ